MGVFLRSGLPEEQRAVRGKRMDSCTRLSINVLKFLGMAMNTYEVMVVRGDRLNKAGESVELKGDNMSTVFWEQQCHGGKDKTRPGGMMSLMRVLEDQSAWCFKETQVKRTNNTLADGLTRCDPRVQTEELTNRSPDVN